MNQINLEKIKEINMDNNQFMCAFGMLANALGGKGNEGQAFPEGDAHDFSRGGNKGQAFPEDDAHDFSLGARHIPGEVTMARQRGEKVVFNSADHSWKMPDGSIVK